MGTAQPKLPREPSVSEGGYWTVELRVKHALAGDLLCSEDAVTENDPVALPVRRVLWILLQEVEAGRSALVQGEVQARTRTGELGATCSRSAEIAGKKGEAEGPDGHQTIALLIDTIDVPPGEAPRSVQKH
jgi:hypothetical protein